MNSKKIFQCEVCNIRIEDWVTVELDQDDVHQIDMQFSYCPKCGTPLGKELYLNHREQALNSVHAVAGTDTCDSIRVVTDFGIIALRVNEPFYLQKNRYRVSIITSKVSNKFFYNVEICECSYICSFYNVGHGSRSRTASHFPVDFLRGKICWRFI